MLTHVLVTASGRPQFQFGEVEIRLLSKVDLELEGEQVTSRKGGVLCLTNFRLIWIPPVQQSTHLPSAPPASCCGLALSAVEKFVSPKWNMWHPKSAPRLKLHVASSGQADPPHGFAAASTGNRAVVVTFAFRGPSSDPLIVDLESAIKAGAWRTSQPLLAEPSNYQSYTPQPHSSADHHALHSSDHQMGEAGGAAGRSSGAPVPQTAEDEEAMLARAIAESLQHGGPSEDGVAAEASKQLRLDPSAWTGAVHGGPAPHASPPLPRPPNAPMPHSAAPPIHSQASPFTPGTAVGIAGLLRAQQAKESQMDASMEAAFLDLSALMEKAGEMVKMSQFLHDKLAGGVGRGSAEERTLGSEISELLLSVGITSPVTRASAGALYHQELSRQLADFLDGGVLEARNGVMTLPDIFCLFNRARGTELVSPDDMLQAARHWQELGLRPRLHEFSSGVKLVRAESHSDEIICGQICTMVAPEGPAGGLGRGVTVGDVAAALGLAPMLAQELLLLAEQRGNLCRDDGPEGLRFYHNFFLDLPLV